MKPAYWQYDTAGTEFIMDRNVKAVRIKNASALVLKDIQFSNGPIEYDVALGQGFPGINFRLSDDRKNGEHFYLRYFGSTSPESRTTLDRCFIPIKIILERRGRSFQTEDVLLKTLP